MNELQAAILRKARESSALKQAFFAEHASRIETCAQQMTDAFARGGRLFVFGNGGSACDAQHVAVEFMHPIFEKRAPLPAIALSCDMALITAKGNDRDFSMTFVEQLQVLARKGDIALGISTSGKSANVNRALAAAPKMGLLAVGFAGRDGGGMPGLCDHCFVVPSFSIHRIQETHETLLHVLWDAIHILRGEEDVL
ncbi:MAG: SIS domain-containing protein [Myxococcales bacterium]|nr:SIS domain-containing protein [Myxococcales bacterium]